MLPFSDTPVARLSCLATNVPFRVDLSAPKKTDCRCGGGWEGGSWPGGGNLVALFI